MSEESEVKAQAAAAPAPAPVEEPTADILARKRASTDSHWVTMDPELLNELEQVNMDLSIAEAKYKDSNERDDETPVLKARQDKL